jgi:hypothetical protein
MTTHLSTTSSAALLAVAAIALATGLGATPPAQAPNTLTADERAAGWRLLFDGTSLDQWRGFREPAVPAGWQVLDGAITRAGRGGDLVSREEFGDFEFAFGWRLAAAGGNSGVMFRVVLGLEQTYHSGPELQLLDDEGHRDGRVPETSCGANYALHASSKPMCRPIGEWNQTRLVVRGAHVEHWMNGEKVVEYELWSPDWKARVAASKFRAWPEYGMATSGHLALQDHGNPVSFRNLKILTR